MDNTKLYDDWVYYDYTVSWFSTSTSDLDVVING